MHNVQLIMIENSEDCYGIVFRINATLQEHYLKNRSELRTIHSFTTDDYDVSSSSFVSTSPASSTSSPVPSSTSPSSSSSSSSADSVPVSISS